VERVLRDPRAPLAGLALAMVASATWLLLAGRGNGLHGDELFYYAHLVGNDGITSALHGLEYLLAPHNAHLVFGGRIAYEVLLDLGGATDYTVFRVVEVLGILLCAGLFFASARRGLEPWVALAMSISLLTLGYANETLMWGFDLHTVYAAALGVAAILLLERAERRADVFACLLLVVSVATLEVGLAFTIGAAVSVLLRAERVRRLWIFVLPLALYVAWWAWAKKFGQSDIELSNVKLIPHEFVEALSAVVGSVLGINSSPEAAFVGTTPAATVAAGFALAGLAYRVRRGAVPPALWAFLATALAYWLTMAMGGRAPDSTRYVFVGTLLVLLVAAEAMKGVRFSPLAIGGFFVVVALAIPPNVAKLNDGKGFEIREAKINGAEYAMLDLAGSNRAGEGYLPGDDPAVEAAGGNVGVGLDTGHYFEGSAEYGGLGMPLDQLRSADVPLRNIADATLVGAYGLQLLPRSAPARASTCPAVDDATSEDVAYFKLEPGGVLLGARSAPVEVSLSRFTGGLPGVALGRILPGHWAAVSIPTDAAQDPWRAVVNGPVAVCPLP
jgi:hypothetical protein